ncbi:Subtilase family protein [Clostridium ljungdahlii DSM 13528]|uniref:Subtilase family protein n=2 Tax=Clostridium ljungdahlii TaxID=1538 RepID=D8GS71_CLOLD|nr:S8 family serine peptidase [Clostridium ljungdahlii]ADK14424.1 subtilin related serine protease [Clostridium ljungdahlii DSM 13528]OAA88155.1 Subtilase family protein [Clostridium ljungdahlii DSM 13528]
MRKKILIITITIVILFAIGGGIFVKNVIERNNPKNWGVNPLKLPDVVTDKVLQKHNSDLEGVYGFQGKDMSKKDLSQVSLDVISNISFDKSTKWPQKSNLPAGYDPNKWFDMGKDPGLNLSKIHEKGITGKGISVAVIDKPIRSTHDEFKGRMNYYKIGIPQTKPHFHGLACASILAGKTCGVASESKLYYFATPDLWIKSADYIKAVNKIIEINKSLPKNEKIRIVSVSDDVDKDNKNYSKWQKTLKKANSEGLTVVHADLFNKEKFSLGGCDASKDRNNPLNYKLSKFYWDEKKIDKSNIMVPLDFKTTADNRSDAAYVYWGEGGVSWAIPYVTGLAALAWQVKPNLTFDQILDKLIETKTTTSEGRYIIDPEKFINSIAK